MIKTPVPTQDDLPDVSLVIPVLNESASLRVLHQEVMQVLEQLRQRFEVIYIDDGSFDETPAILEGFARADRRVKVVFFGRNFGQTAALAAGFDQARGEIILPCDGDLQNDPKDIPAILEKVKEGYDVVSCWRKNRKDSWLTRRIPSYLANLLISWVSGVRLHDYGCTLKAYRRSVLRHVRLYGEMHRFIPIYAYWAGGRVTEMIVNHRRRRYGKSKYGLMRTGKVLMDLLTVRFLGSYSTKPMYLFGGLGSLLCLGGIFFAVATLYQKFAAAVKAHRNPMLLLAVFLFSLGVQFILIGLVAELIMRTYYESQGKQTYVIRKSLNISLETGLQPSSSARNGKGGEAPT